MISKESFDTAPCAEQIDLAERELASFIGAVMELFGPEQARLCAEDWLEESEVTDNPRRSTGRDWREITVGASVRLARRLNAGRDNRLLIGTQVATLIDTKVSPIPSSNCFLSELLV